MAQDSGILKSVGLDVRQQVIRGIGSANAVVADGMNVEAGLMKASDKLPSFDKIFTNEYVK